MPTKGNVRRITITIPYNKKIRLYRGKIRESVKAEARPSGSAGDSASLSLSVQPFSLCYGVCLSGGAKRRHLSMTSTRHGAKL